MTVTAEKKEPPAAEHKTCPPETWAAIVKAYDLMLELRREIAPKRSARNRIGKELKEMQGEFDGLMLRAEDSASVTREDIIDQWSLLNGTRKQARALSSEIGDLASRITDQSDHIETLIADVKSGQRPLWQGETPPAR